MLHTLSVMMLTFIETYDGGIGESSEHEAHGKFFLF